MIEIKNKRMLLYPEDRLIGAEGDVNTAERKFVLDALQGGYDLSNFVAFIKLEPSGSDTPYDQLLKKENQDDKLILTWKLTGANLKNAGELTAQIVLASPDFFSSEDLDTLDSEQLVVPSFIEGVSAPVWQSFKETFVIDESIDGTAAYSEVSKNVLTAALAQCAQNVEECQSIQNSVAIMYGSVCENLEACETLASNTDTWAHNAAASCEGAEAAAENSEKFCAQAEVSAQKALESENTAYAFEQSALSYSQKSEEIFYETEKIAAKVAGLYRRIFSKTISEADAGCVSFEVTEDSEKAPLSLSAFTIYMYIPKMADSTSNYLRLDIKSAMGDSYSRIAQFAGISKSTDIYSKIEARNLGRWNAKFSKASAWFQNAESVNVYNTLCANSRGTDGRSACAIRILQASPIDFPVGTYIEIWGIDAPESEVRASE